MLTKEEIEANQRRYLELLRKTGRDGMEKVIDYMESNGFFVMPSSISRHHNWEGGLTQHCLGVYDRLCKTGENLPEDSKIIVSLLHDICKAEKLYKVKGEWKEKKDDELDFPGHGERSVYILKDKCHLPLSEEERKAIEWHMGGYNIPKEKIRDFFATMKSDLWRLHHNADRYDASHNGK